MEDKNNVEIVTDKFEDFGSRERLMVVELLNAWDEQGLPDSFYEDEVKPMLNRNSGYVFLTNSDYQVAMMNGDKLELFLFTPYDGEEGFLDELIEICDGFLWEDLDYIYSLSNEQQQAVIRATCNSDYLKELEEIDF